jgi:hypothetical protein
MKGIIVGFRNIQQLLIRDVNLFKYFCLWEKDNISLKEKLFVESALQHPNLQDLKYLFKSQDLIRSSSEVFIEQMMSIQSLAIRYQMIKNSLYFLKLMCGEAVITEPYLRAVSSFLASDGETVSLINDKAISYFDRLGFALRFCDNEKLKGFCQQSITKAKEEGLLQLIIL